MGRHLQPDVETVFMVPKESSPSSPRRLVREIASLGGDVGDFVHPPSRPRSSSASQRGKPDSGSWRVDPGACSRALSPPRAAGAGSAAACPGARAPPRATDTRRRCCDKASSARRTAPAPAAVGMPFKPYASRKPLRTPKSSHRQHIGTLQLKHQHHLDRPATDAAHRGQPLDDLQIRQQRCSSSPRRHDALDGLGGEILERSDLGEREADGAQPRIVGREQLRWLGKGRGRQTARRSARGCARRRCRSAADARSRAPALQTASAACARAAAGRDRPPRSGRP